VSDVSLKASEGRNVLSNLEKVFKYEWLFVL